MFRSVFGLVLISYHHGSATSATMALCSVVLFFLVPTLAAVCRSIGGHGGLAATKAPSELIHTA